MKNAALVTAVFLLQDVLNKGVYITKTNRQQ